MCCDPSPSPRRLFDELHFLDVRHWSQDLIRKFLLELLATLQDPDVSAPRNLSVGTMPAFGMWWKARREDTLMRVSSASSAPNGSREIERAWSAVKKASVLKGCLVKGMPSSALSLKVLNVGCVWIQDSREKLD